MQFREGPARGRRGRSTRPRLRSSWPCSRPRTRLPRRFGHGLRRCAPRSSGTGTYAHTTAELTFGARVAWRNSSRCIGRLYWRTLQVRDRRHVTDAAQLAGEAFAHLREATNGGRIRPTHHRVRPGHARAARPEDLERAADPVRRLPPAGRRRSSATRATPASPAPLLGLGWPGGPGTPFDVLPLVVRSPAAGPRCSTLPERRRARGAARATPTLSVVRRAGAALARRARHLQHVPGDRRRLLPGRALQRLVHGHRDRRPQPGRRHRYDLLPVVADRLGLDTATDRSLWRDRRWSSSTAPCCTPSTRAGVTIADHHTESRRFLTHLAREERAGRITAPPTGRGSCRPSRAPPPRSSTATTRTPTSGRTMSTIRTRRTP